MQLYLLYLQIIPTFVPIKSNPIINKTSTAVMKKKTILFASCLLGALAFSSCEKNLYDESKQPEKEKKMTDLEVPADFDWKGSQNAKVKIASQSTATISVFLEENCNEEALMLRMDVDANTSKLELIIRKTKCSPLFKRSDISYKTKRPPKNNFPKYSRGSKKSTGKFCFSQCFFL